MLAVETETSSCGSGFALLRLSITHLPDPTPATVYCPAGTLMTGPAPRARIGAVAMGSFAIVRTMGLLENRSRQDVLDSAGWVSRALHVRRELVRTRMLLTDAETGQRGYLLTLDESYLDPNEQARAAMPAVMAQLRRLTADNPRQQQRLSDLDRLATETLAELRDTVVAAPALQGGHQPHDLAGRIRQAHGSGGRE